MDEPRRRAARTEPAPRLRVIAPAGAPHERQRSLPFRELAVLDIRPRPIQTVTVYSARDDETEIIRRWTSETATACRLCARCKAQHGPDGQAVCVVRIDGPIDERSAPLFSPLGG